MLGNATTWARLLAHVTSTRTKHEPIVVWGPTGCGKTCGVRDIAKASSMQVVEMDGVEADTTPQLIDWLTRIRDIKLMQGQTLLVVDDFESFTVEARARIVEWMRKTRGQSHLCPMVITCTNIKEPSMRSLQSLTQLRLCGPDAQTCRRWFQTNGFEGSDGVVRMPTPSAFLGEVQSHILASCDLRRVKIMLQWTSSGGTCVGGCGASLVDLSSRSPFEATRRLLTRHGSASEWAQHAQSQDLDLVREHALKYVVADDVNAFARVYDTLSLCDTSRSTTSTTWETHHAMQMYTAALGIIVDVYATRGVDALFPSSLSTGARHSKKNKKDEYHMHLDSPSTTSMYIDVPTVLRSE
ncbi:MAG: AAA family ATPase [Chitinophagia bacterium]|nr:AAA family ATPase [Chitinophagia bacterium]